MNKSAASAAFPDYMKFQAVIKSAASAASRTPKSRDQAPGERPEHRRLQTEPPSGAPPEVGPLDLVFRDAALAANLITA